jgi:phosphate transport system substrate-binding protein
VIKQSLAIAVLAGIAMAATAPASARDQIRIVGSSTVFPFSTAVAENFGKVTKFKTPVVESTGTGGGMKLFCAGAGDDTPDITNASRRIKKSEYDTCAKNGIGITEVRIGFDGIVLANAKSAPRFTLSKQEIFLALAKQVPGPDGKLIANPYKMWNEINPALPAEKIEVLGPPPTSGTRDAFVELAMDGGAETIESLKALDKDTYKTVSQTLREDGAFIEAGENDNLIVQKLEANPTAVGIFGFSYLDQNADKLQGAIVDGKEPTFENIADGSYTVSRSLYFYVKQQHIDQVPGIKEYVAEFTNDRAWGDDGYLVEKGLIPLPVADRKIMRDMAKGMTPLSM